MSKSELQQSLLAAAKIAADSARVLLNVSEDIPLFGKAAKLINKLIQICDQCKCNKDASRALQVRFCYLAHHIFSGPEGLATIANSRPNNTSLAVFCRRMETILEKGVYEVDRFTKGGFMKSILKGNKPQETFEDLDRDMTQCLNELSVVLQTTALNEQAQMYDVVCNIQAMVDERGGLDGLLADPVQLESLAQEIGADVNDLKVEVLQVLESLGTQVSVVDENVREMKAKVDAVHQAVVLMQKTTAAPDMTALQLTVHPVVDRTQVLGEGAFGKVYKGTYNHIEVAVKEVSVGAAHDKEFLREVAMHHKVGNLPGVVRLFGANFNTQPRCIVLELAAGTLHDALHKARPEIDHTLPSKLSLLAQVCATMAAISDMGILHRDLKSSNVLLFFNNDRAYAKISDFGLTKMSNESTISSAGAAPKGTLPYMAPELFRGHYSSASDMYAFAVLLNEVLVEQVPFPGRGYVEIVQSVGTFRHRPDRYKAEFADPLGCELMRFIERCWHQDPQMRMSFHELAAELNHLLRKAAETARVGNQATALTPPRPPANEIETSISVLADWLTSSCHLAATDALPLAHTLVTVKHITSVPILTHIVQRNPDFLSKEMNFGFVHEAKIFTALGMSVKSTTSTTSVKLESLSSAQLSQLLDHCNMHHLHAFPVLQSLNGMQLADGIDCVQDLVDLGLDMLTAKALFKRITLWRDNGLPADFAPISLSTQAPSPHTPSALNTDIPLQSVPPGADSFKVSSNMSADAGTTGVASAHIRLTEESREEWRKIAMEPRYDLNNFPNLRTAADYASDADRLTKNKLEETFLTFQATVIPKSITFLGEEDNKLALQINKDILSFMVIEEGAAYPAELAQNIVRAGNENRLLRDEIYMQIIKQLTDNPQPAGVARGWQLMSMCVALFPPSQEFENFLLHYIIEKKDRGRKAVVDYARYCLWTLESIINLGEHQAHIPSIREMLAYKERPPILATIYLIDGNIVTENMPLTPDINVATLLELCCGWLDLKDSRINTLGMFVYDLGEIGEQKASTDSGVKSQSSDLIRTPHPLGNGDYMGDAFVRKAREQRKFKFVLKLKLFFPKDNYRGKDLCFQRLLYLQAVDEVIDGGNIIITSAEDIELLTAINMIVAYDEYMPNTVTGLVEADVKAHVPLHCRKTKTVEEWARIVLSNRDALICDNLDDLQYRFVQIVQKFPTYGHHWFYVRKLEPSAVEGVPQSILQLPRELLFAYCAEGLYIYTFSQEFVLSLKYEDILRWTGSYTELTLTIEEDSGNTYQFQLATHQAADMRAIAFAYIEAKMVAQKASNIAVK